MRSKRLLTILLAFCMLLTVMAPGVSAVTAGEHQHSHSVESANNANASADKDNSLLVSGEDAYKGYPTLRDESLTSIGTSAGNNVIGNWNIQAVEGNIDVSLLDADSINALAELKEASRVYAEDDVVAAFIVLESSPLVSTYSSIQSVSQFKLALMEKQQETVISRIEKNVLGGDELDVRRQFTYLTNSITVNVEFGKLDEIAAMNGVKSVFLMPVYDPCDVDKTVSVSNPYTVSAGEMSGVPGVWAEELGYTGTGMTIAVIDTGLDLDHPSFAADPETNENSLTVEDINAVLADLNASDYMPGVTAEDLYVSVKVPFAFNYVDANLTADHSADSMGDHGTHVSGISAANAVEGTGVVGMAPDAQVVVMKVFGAAGGAYMDDILAALEDAMTLGCDVANLSLGSAAGFSSIDPEIDEIFNRIAETDINVNISAGNDGTSALTNNWGTDMNTTSNPDNATVSAPSTYANATSVASVDNAMILASALNLNGVNYMYNDGIGLNVTFDSLAGQELEYVIVPGLGEAADFEGLDVAGKIAVIARGTINFSTKLYNAEQAGAIGVIITNNEPGSIASFGMSFEGGEQSGDVPAVLVTQATGQALANAENKVLTVCEEPQMVLDEGGGQMSVFSSWGVTPDLRLLPDIAGVGGNVYSCYDGGEYGFMSGTSMSSPQVAGVSALVIEYLKEQGVADEDIRTMLNGLLMSTAVPVVSTTSSVEASPRQQGSGLVNALNAITSEAYLTVNGDRPKAELGDDPGKTGVYTFTFTVHNFSDAEKSYTLSGSLLTESVVGYYVTETDVEFFMAGYDMPLEGTVAFENDTVTVPAGSTAEVTVTVTLADWDKAVLDYYYPNGGYVEGFVYLDNTDENGVDLSLPYMGFYGDWTEPSAFDYGYWYDNSFWDLEPAEGGIDAHQYFHVLWTDLDGTSWVLGMNPYSGATVDENGNIEYDPSNNVISNNGDGLIDNLDDIYISLMRNVKELRFTYTNETTGEVVYEEVLDYVSKTTYNSAYGQIIPYVHSWYGNLWDFSDANGDPLPSGTKLMLTISAKLDYADGGDSVMEIPITLDSNVPELNSASSLSINGVNYMSLNVTDETNLAAAYLMNPTGTQIYDTVYSFTKEADGSYTILFDVTGLGTELMVCLADYGANEGYYELTYSGDDNLPEMDTSALYAYRVADSQIATDHLYGWVTIDEETAEVTQLSDDYMEYYALTAAEYVDGYIFAVDAGYNFLVMQPGVWNRKTICNLGVGVLDMTFDKSTNTMFITTKQAGENWDTYTLSTLDLLTGEMDVIKSSTSSRGLPYAMAATDDGVIYAVKNYDSYLYTVNKETGAMTYVTDADGNYLRLYRANGTSSASPYYNQSMTYSTEDGCIYWAFFSSSGAAELFTIIPATETEAVSYSSVVFPVAAEFVGLLTLDEDPDYTLPESDALSKLMISESSAVMMEGEQLQLTVDCLPWNYTPSEDVVWSSSDDSVATVDADGVVTAVSEGTVTITAACEGLTATCEIAVVRIEGSVYGYDYYSGLGYGDWFQVGLNPLSYESLYYSPVDFLTADYNGHDGNIYGYDSYGQFYCYNPSTGVATALGSPVSAAPVDMAYDYSTGLMYAIISDSNAWTTTLYYVNMNNGQLIEAGMMYDFCMTLACSTEGELYTVSYDGILYSIAPVEGYLDAQYIMEGLPSAYFVQSMCYDHNSDVLIWACADHTSFYWIDPEMGVSVSLGDPTGTGLFEFIGLYTIPEEIPELAYAPVESVTAKDMVVLTGGSKLADVTILPLNATNQAITWTSADESIATVDAFGKVTGVSEGVTTVTGVLVDGETTLETSFTVTVKESADNIYGYIVTDIASYGGDVWAQIDDRNPTTGTQYLAASPYTMYSAEYVDGLLYGYGFDSYDWEANFQYMTIDPETYEILSITDMGDGFPFVYDMTYDYTTGTMYAVAGYNDSSSDLYMVDMATGELVLVMDIEPMFLSLAADAEGNLYGMAKSNEEFDYETWMTSYSNALLYKIDVLAGTYEAVLDTGVTCNALSSIAFDYDTGNLYWTRMCQSDAYYSGLFLIDLEDGGVYDLGMIGAAGSQVTCLHILADSYPETPDSLYNITLNSTSETLNVGETVELSVIVQPSDYEVEESWSSADESVVTVEDGVVTAVGSGVTTVTVTVTDGDKTITATCAIIVYSEDDYLLTYNWTDGGFSAVNRQDPTVVTNLTEAEEYANIRAMAMVDGVIYGYDVDGKFFSTTEESGFTRTYLGDTALEEMYEDDEEYNYYFEVRDMAWDSTNDRMLALVCHSVEELESGYFYELVGGCKIYEVDLTTGALTELVTMTYPSGDEYSNAYTMTVTDAGEVYFFSSFMDYIGTVDLTTGVVTEMTTLQNQGVYGGSDGEPMAMAYDPITCSIYMIFTSNGSFYQMFNFNPNTGATTLLGKVGEVAYANWKYTGDLFAGLVIDAEHVHAYGDWKVITPATCTENGLEGETCLLCGEQGETAIIEATGHTFGEWTLTKAPTCTEAGEETRVCHCGATESREVATVGHDYEAVVTEPTCTQAGYTTYTCSVCGDSYVTDYVSANGHSYEAVVTEPTCTEAGYTTYTCSVCGDSYVSDYVSATGHTFGEWTETKAPTCTEAGEEARSCACGETETREVAALGHSYVSVVTEPTCTEAGYTTHTCSACGDSYVSDYVNATGHTFGEWTETKAPTCTEAGEEARSCACGETETREVAALGHSYVSVVTEPTCTEAGYTTYTCSVCGDSYVSDYVSATGHTFGDWIETKAPTCTEKGEETRSCACGETETREVAALGHSYESVVTEPTCTEAGYTTHTCSACGDSYTDSETAATGHSYVDKVTKPTETEEGYTTHTCEHCGDSYVDSYTPAVPDGSSNTGDTTPAILWIVILVVSLCGVVLLLIKRKQIFRK